MEMGWDHIKIPEETYLHIPSAPPIAVSFLVFLSYFYFILSCRLQFLLLSSPEISVPITSSDGFFLFKIYSSWSLSTCTLLNTASSAALMWY